MRNEKDLPTQALHPIALDRAVVEGWMTRVRHLAVATVSCSCKDHAAKDVCSKPSWAGRPNGKRIVEGRG